MTVLSSRQSTLGGTGTETHPALSLQPFYFARETYLLLRWTWKMTFILEMSSKLRLEELIALLGYFGSEEKTFLFFAKQTHQHTKTKENGAPVVITETERFYQQWQHNHSCQCLQRPSPCTISFVARQACFTCGRCNRWCSPGTDKALIRVIRQL